MVGEAKFCRECRKISGGDVRQSTQRRLRAHDARKPLRRQADPLVEEPREVARARPARWTESLDANTAVTLLDGTYRPVDALVGPPESAEEERLQRGQS